MLVKQFESDCQTVETHRMLLLVSVMQDINPWNALLIQVS